MSDFDLLVWFYAMRVKLGLVFLAIAAFGIALAALISLAYKAGRWFQERIWGEHDWGDDDA